MRRILSLIAVVALMLAFAMPVMTADAASHKKPMPNPCNPCASKVEDMKKEAGDKAEDMKGDMKKEAGDKAEDMKKK